MRHAEGAHDRLGALREHAVLQGAEEARAQHGAERARAEDQPAPRQLLVQRLVRVGGELLAGRAGEQSVVGLDRGAGDARHRAPPVAPAAAPPNSAPHAGSRATRPPSRAALATRTAMSAIVSTAHSK